MFAVTNNKRQMNIYMDLEMQKALAIANSIKHDCNYSVILLNPDNGLFGEFSTYEIVTDSYFAKPRPNSILMFSTKVYHEQQSKRYQGYFEDDGAYADD